MKIPNELIKRQQEAFEEALNMYKKSKYKSNQNDIVKEIINIPENVDIKQKDITVLEEIKKEPVIDIMDENKVNQDIIILKENIETEKLEKKIFENKKNKNKNNIQNNYNKINNISGLHYNMLTPCIQKKENNKKK